MSCPVERMGPEVGWTTLHYYSKHDEVRRDIWRDQWKKRQQLEDNSQDRYETERCRIETRREDWRDQNYQDRKEREEREKRRAQREKERREHHQNASTLYQKEAKAVRMELYEEQVKEKAQIGQQWSQVADSRAKRAANREQQRKEWLGDN